MQTLGLKLVSEDNYAIEFRGQGAVLRITTVQELKPYPFTVLGFKVNEIIQEVKSLMGKGVIFEGYDSLAQDDIGIWIYPLMPRLHGLRIQMATYFH